MNPSNTVSVSSLIEEIQSELKHQAGSWRKVSELLNQSDVEFGFGTDEMKQILDQTDISPSKASKLISIGNRLLFCNFRIESRVQNRKQSDEAKQYNFNPRLMS